MNEFRITMSVHDEELEKNIKEILEQYSTEVYVVEEHGDAGTVIEIISIIVSFPAFVKDMKETIQKISKWFSEKKKEATGEEEQSVASGIIENPLEWNFSINGYLYSVDNIESEEERDMVVDLIIAEYKLNG